MIITLPILIPLFLIILLLFAGKNVRLQKNIGLAGSFVLLVSAIAILYIVKTEGILVMHAGNWKAPYGISLVIDLFSAIMLVISGIIGFCVGLYAWYGIDENRHTYRFYVFFHAVLMGVNGAFITGDIFNLYVWIEIMLMASFALMVLGGERYQLEGAIKYVTLNLIASFFYLAAIAVLYSDTGTLNMAELASMLTKNNSSVLANAAAMLFFISLGIKAALFPFFYWLPASYHTPPIAVTALFAGLLTKVGVYALIRFFTLFFVQNQEFWHPLLLVVAGLTMFVGVITAASQMEMRRILSFHIISQIGYMIMGLGLFTPLAIAGSIYFMVHNIIAKTNAFLVAGLIQNIRGTYFLKSLGDLYKKKPGLAILFFIPAMALAGVPPLSGFFGKFLLVKSGFEAEQYLIATVSLVVSLLTTFSMVKIWNEVFWKKNKIVSTEEISGGDRNRVSKVVPTVILAALSVFLGVGANYFIGLCMDAADQLLDSSNYIMSVLGK